MPDIYMTKLLDIIVDKLDIPRSYYEKACARHKSLGEWLCRPQSRVAAYQPRVSPQGSFRFGTVNLPIHADAEYDLDNVTTLQLAKTAMTQRQIKELYGSEIKDYAAAHSMTNPVEETNRCWRLHYSDDVAFHLDSLPALAEEQAIIKAIISRGVAAPLEMLAVAITDRRHPNYDHISSVFLSSNPGGFAKWFEEQTRPWALARIYSLLEKRLYKSVEDVPPYEWRTPLQRSIQFLKRHRDVMFRDNPRVAPISMIITNLAAHAYEGESDIHTALMNIVEKMPQFVKQTRPRVPNPADPAEDYADKWSHNPILEQNFWTWHSQVKVDLVRLTSLLRSSTLASDVRRILSVDLSEEEMKQVRPQDVTPVVPRPIRAASVLSIPTAPKPWGKK